jgi:cytochrome c-type biogenesis protein
MIFDFLTSFWLGLLTPLGAVCVLPLFPGLLSYLANKVGVEQENKQKTLILLGLIVTAGVITFMLLLGMIFTTILQKSLTNIINIISPIAFGILIIISLLLIFNVDYGRFLPKLNVPVAKNPYWGAYLYGFLFGAIVIPCNPAFIAAMFTKTLAVSTTRFITNMFNFLFFGIGMGFPLLLFSFISATKSSQVIGFLTKYKRQINLIAGVIMLVISLYYLVFVFRVFG